MAVPIQSPVPSQHALPTLWLARTAVVLFVAALAVATFPATPMGPSPFGFVTWAAIVVAAFILSAAAAFTSQERGHRVLRTPLGYSALVLLTVTAALLVVIAAPSRAGANPEGFLTAMTITGVAAATLGTLAAFRAKGAPIRLLPSTPSGWWAAAFLAAFLAVQFTPWAVLTPATAMAGPALALTAILNYRDRSVLSALALVVAPGQMTFFAVLTLISPFTVAPGA